MATRPENICPPEIYYNKEEAAKYTNSTRIIDIQEQLTERCLELLGIEDDEEQLILDIGCGSGLSGQSLSENGHMWVGVDISRDMLDVAVERESEGDLLEVDMG